MRVLVISALLVLARVASAQVQDLGHRLPGGVGLDAGTQPAPGIYLGYRFAWFTSERINDRNGDELPITGFDLDGYSNIFGVSATWPLDDLYFSVAFAAPVAKISISADVPQASIDRLGLGDMFVEPLKVGRRFARGDVVASYAFYVPTQQVTTSMIGQPQWSHQLSVGAARFFDNRRGWRLSALASYVHNQEKLEVDITRGDTFQIQGGIGGPVVDGVEVGIAGYALWQVTDDYGADLPEPLRGARERAFGLGPEVDVTIPALRSRMLARLQWDLDGKARPVGALLVIGLSVVVWR